MTALQLNAEIYRAMGEIADNETLLAKVLVYVKSLVPTKEAKTETGWADRFVGAWKDDRSADEIVNDIRSARTANEIDIELWRAICLTQASVWPANKTDTLLIIFSKSIENNRGNVWFSRYFFVTSQCEINPIY